ncbi:MAG: hypothetical protein Q9218_002880 [Villophora microphyllina]
MDENLLGPEDFADDESIEIPPDDNNDPCPEDGIGPRSIRPFENPRSSTKRSKPRPDTMSLSEACAMFKEPLVFEKTVRSFTDNMVFEKTRHTIKVTFVYHDNIDDLDVVKDISLPHMFVTKPIDTARIWNELHGGTNTIGLVEIVREYKLAPIGKLYVNGKGLTDLFEGSHGKRQSYD